MCRRTVDGEIRAKPSNRRRASPGVTGLVVVSRWQKGAMCWRLWRCADAMPTDPHARQWSVAWRPCGGGDVTRIVSRRPTRGQVTPESGDSNPIQQVTGLARYTTNRSRQRLYAARSSLPRRAYTLLPSWPYSGSETAERERRDGPQRVQAIEGRQGRHLPRGLRGLRAGAAAAQADLHEGTGRRAVACRAPLWVRCPGSLASCRTRQRWWHRSCARKPSVRRAWRAPA